MGRILIVDDEPSICWGLRELMTDAGHDVTTAASAEAALTLCQSARFDVIVLDVRLPGMDGLTAIHHLRRHVGPIPVVVITAFGDLDTAVRAVSEGAFEYLVKPFDLDQAADVLRRAFTHGETNAEVRSSLPRSALPNDELIGRSPAMQRVFKQIALAARSEVAVLITGESGTGKELVAQALHRHGPRANQPFVPVCVPALSPTLVESELFGHKKGAFTGADVDRVGLFERANGGTLFLDEIGDVPLNMQVKLLRALERGEVTPVGGSRPSRVDVRVIAATNRDLGDSIRSGEFREDLYYRLAVFGIELPSLRERPEDIPVLAEHFLARVSGSGFTPEALQELRSRRWAGNVRELRNAVEHAAVLARGERIGPDQLPAPLPIGADSESSPEDQIRALVREWAERRDEEEGTIEAFLTLVEPVLMRSALERCENNRAAAARWLGIHRATLRQKLRQHGMDDER